MMGVAAESLALRPYAGDLRYSGYPLVQETPQVVPGQRDQKVQAFPPQRAQQPLAERIGLGAPHWSFEHPEPQMAHTAGQVAGRKYDPGHG